MAENCSHNCSSCGETCSSRNEASLKKKPHEMSDIKRVIAVVSGKGGVGKSMTSAMLACASQGVIVNGKLIACDTISNLTSEKNLEDKFFDLYSAATEGKL